MEVLREYRVLLPVSLLSVIFLSAVAFYYGASFAEILTLAIAIIKMTGMLLFAFLGLAVLLFLVMSFFRGWRDGKSVAENMAAFNTAVDHFFTPSRIMPGLVGVGIYVLIAIMIGLGKSLIPYVHGYDFDPMFSEMDKVIHGGVYPDRLLVPLVQRFQLYGFFNFIYLFWFHVMFGATACALFYDADSKRRMRFLWSSLVLWLAAGILGAMIFSSVGPIYYSEFYPQLENPYAELLHILKEINVSTELNVMKVSDLLLGFSRNDSVVDLNGISAMPSMHVGIVTLITCYAFSRSKWWGWICAFYTLLITMGSVILGWHYAIDGYAAIIAAIIVWACVGRILEHPATIHLHDRNFFSSH